MFRKFFAAFVALTLVVGGLFAEEVKGVFKKFEDGKVTVSVDDKDKTFKSAEKFKGKKGEMPAADVFGKMKDGDKVTLTVEDNVVTKAKKDKK